MKKTKSMGSIFVDMLSECSDEATKSVIEHVNDMVKSDVCAELFDLLVINALGYKCPITASTIDNAVDYIIGKKCSEIDASPFSEEDREYEKQQWCDFYLLVGSDMKKRFACS